jgi:hypothetical protein
MSRLAITLCVVVTLQFLQCANSMAQVACLAGTKMIHTYSFVSEPAFRIRNNCSTKMSIKACEANGKCHFAELEPDHQVVFLGDTEFTRWGRITEAEYIAERKRHIAERERRREQKQLRTIPQSN